MFNDNKTAPCGAIRTFDMTTCDRFSGHDGAHENYRKDRGVAMWLNTSAPFPSHVVPVLPRVYITVV